MYISLDFNEVFNEMRTMFRFISALCNQLEKNEEVETGMDS